MNEEKEQLVICINCEETMEEGEISVNEKDEEYCPHCLEIGKLMDLE